jgi:hypothetical protein
MAQKFSPVPLRAAHARAKSTDGITLRLGCGKGIANKAQ